MIKRRRFLAVILPLLSLALHAQKEGSVAAIDSYVAPYVWSANFSGVVLVEKGGRTLFEKAYGLENREKRVANTSKTRFHVASVSMQFTAAAVLRLIDKGQLKLDTKVNDVVPGVNGGDKITIQDLLLQRSGLSDINELPDYKDVLKQHQTPASLVAKIKDRPLLFEPGTKFMHEEHSAYNLLALIVETKTHQPFSKALKKLVFDPAGLSHTGVDDDSLKSKKLARGYQPKGVSDLEPATEIHWSGKAGNASIVTTAGDQARWIRMLLAGDFLNKSSRDLLLVTVPPVGYGWFRRENTRFHEVAYYMNGRAPGFASFVLYLPKEDLVVVAFSNIYSSVTTTLGNDIGAIALGLPYEPFLPNQSPLTAEQLKKSTGTFKFGPDFYQKNAEVSLVANGNELSLRWPSGDLSPLISISEDHFVDRSYWEPVSIERDSTGAPNKLTFDRFSGDVVRNQ